jgi:hypothetical protein
LTNKYLEVKAGSAHLTYEGQVDPYFTVEVDATNGQFIFTQTGKYDQNGKPEGNIGPNKVTITAVDQAVVNSFDARTVPGISSESINGCAQ